MTFHMKRPLWSTIVHHLLTAAALTLALSALFVGVLTEVNNASADANPGWAEPGVTALKRVGNLNPVQHEPTFVRSLDCTLLTYRQVGSSAMQSGCFVNTAMGLYDMSSRMMIFNGTDEALPILERFSGQVLVPWPQAGVMLSLRAAPLGGSSVGLYRNMAAVLKDHREFGRLTGKELTAPPEIALRNASGAPLIINADTLAFSPDGAWLVAEEDDSSFIRINLASLDVTAFAPAPAAHGDPALSASRVAVSRDGRFVAIANRITQSFKVYDLDACANSGASAAYQRCSAAEYQPFIRERLPDLQFVGHPRFINDRLISFEANMANVAHNGVYELSPNGEIRALLEYIGLGDSYTSGEGAFDYLLGTDTADNPCHLSTRSYPLLLARDLFSETAGHSVACSGAVIRDIGSTDGAYRGQVRNGTAYEDLQRKKPPALAAIMGGFAPGYVAQHRFVAEYQPRITTVSIGGNDIGFGDILQQCVAPHLGLPGGGNTCFNSYEDRREVTDVIDRTVPRWAALFRQLTDEAPETTLYVVGYPQVADPNGNCGANVHLNRTELLFSQQLISYLNDAIRGAALNAGVQYVDISDALKGHRLCEAAGYDVAVNGLTAGKDALGLLGRESYHPNMLGHQLIEQSILTRTRNLTLGATSVTRPDTPTVSELFNAPKTGRQVVRREPRQIIAAQTVRAGQAFAVHIGGLSNGLRSNEIYQARLDGPLGLTLVTLNSSTDADLNGTLTLPSLAPGVHTLDITGKNQADEPIDITQAIYAPPAGADQAGCPDISNSAQDTDQDGIDDACDPVIGSPPAPNLSLPTNKDGSGPPGTADTSSAPLQAKVFPSNSSAPSPSAANSPVLDFGARDSPATKSGLRTATESPWLLWVLLSLVAGVVPVTAGILWPGPHLKMRKLTKLPQTVLKFTTFNYTKWMIWLRKGVVHLFAVILLFALLGGVTAAGFNRTLAQPDKLKTWLTESNIYDQTVSDTLHTAQNSGQTDSSVSLENAQVRQAAEEVFTPQLVQKNVDLFIDANYAWLQGKTAEPEFKIDLSGSKQTFAQKIGTLVQTRLSGLPVCTTTQLAQLQIPTDPLTVSCRPATLDVKPESQRVAREVMDGRFLNQPVITASNLDSLDTDGDQSQQKQASTPYYQNFSQAPTIYKVAVKLPYICAALAIVSLLVIFWAAPSRRRGIRRVGFVFLSAGVLLFFARYMSDSAVARFQHNTLNQTAAQQLQKPLGDLLHRIESSWMQAHLLFAVLFTVMALAAFIYLFATRQRAAAVSSPASSRPDATADSDTTYSANAAANIAPILDEAPASKPALAESRRPSGQGQAPLAIKKPRPRRSPRLIQ